MKALRKAGKKFQYLEFPHEVHGLLLEANRVAWYERLVAFFEEHLAPPAPYSTVRSAERGTVLPGTLAIRR